MGVMDKILKQFIDFEVETNKKPNAVYLGKEEFKEVYELEMFSTCENPNDIYTSLTGIEVFELGIDNHIGIGIK